MYDQIQCTQFVLLKLRMCPLADFKVGCSSTFFYLIYPSILEELREIRDGGDGIGLFSKKYLNNQKTFSIRVTLTSQYHRSVVYLLNF